MGGCAIDAFGDPSADDTSLETCLKACDSVLLGAVGGPKWDDQPSANRPERGLLQAAGRHEALYKYPSRPDVSPSWPTPAPPKQDIADPRHRL